MVIKKATITTLNSVPYTKKADLFSKHSMERVIHKVLKNDARKALDSAAHAQFDATVWTVQPDSGTSNTAVQFATDGTFANVTSVEMQKEHVQAIVDELAENDVTPYDGEHYMCIARPGTYRTFKQDLEAISFYVESGFREIKAGEIGRYEGVRFFSQTNIASASYTASDQAYFFGADAVTEAIVEPEQIRAKLPGDSIYTVVSH